jgi:hypothetical protein
MSHRESPLVNHLTTCPDCEEALWTCACPECIEIRVARACPIGQDLLWESHDLQMRALDQVIRCKAH